MSIEELSNHAPALDILLTDKVKRDQARRRFQKKYNFSKEQVFALIPKQTAGRKKGGALPNAPNAPETPDNTQEAEPDAVNTCQISPKETIRDLAQRIIWDNLEMRALEASEKIVSDTKIPDTTRSANKIQKENRLLHENEGIDYPDHFSLESFKERLDLYDVSNIPDKQALADVMIMLCIRPAEIKDLRISNGSVTGSPEKNEERARQLLIWIQEAISSGQLKDPGKPGAVFAVVAHGAKNLSKAETIASEALRHSPDNHASPAKNYIIVNYRLRGEPYNQAMVFELSGEN
ncbi:hypothetical protein GLOIN_2v1785145 [Rhizophagus irregularis DAOM 181602=DAOM 197198]|nr:hypothetical protein GLOIN_2v1785145 [Rhizophagus irregularis DAOM 181602=DAOM 197198]